MEKKKLIFIKWGLVVSIALLPIIFSIINDSIDEISFSQTIWAISGEICIVSIVTVSEPFWECLVLKNKSALSYFLLVIKLFIIILSVFIYGLKQTVEQKEKILLKNEEQISQMKKSNIDSTNKNVPVKTLEKNIDHFQRDLLKIINHSDTGLINKENISYNALCKLFNNTSVDKVSLIVFSDFIDDISKDYFISFFSKNEKLNEQRALDRKHSKLVWLSFVTFVISIVVGFISLFHTKKRDS